MVNGNILLLLYSGVSLYHKIQSNKPFQKKILSAQHNTVNWLISILSNSVGDENCMGFLALESSVGEPFEDGTDHTA